MWWCNQSSGCLCHCRQNGPLSTTPVPAAVPVPSSPDDETPNPAAGSNGEERVVASWPAGPFTRPIAAPVASPLLTTALIEPWEPTPFAFLILKTPTTRPTPVSVSTRLAARIEIVPLRRASLLVAVPVYVASVEANVSLSLIEQVVSFACETVVALNVADADWAFGPPAASATPVAASAARASGVSSKRCFLDIGFPLGVGEDEWSLIGR